MDTVISKSHDKVDIGCISKDSVGYRNHHHLLFLFLGNVQLLVVSVLENGLLAHIYLYRLNIFLMLRIC